MSPQTNDTLTITTTSSNIEFSDVISHQHHQQLEEEEVEEEFVLFPHTTSTTIDNNNSSILEGCDDVETLAVAVSEAGPTARLEEEEVEEDDDVTIIPLDRPNPTTAHHVLLQTPTNSDNYGRTATGQAAWILATRDTGGTAALEDDEVRLNRILRDLERVQSYNCCHFMIWCLVPTVLLIFVLVCVYQDTKNNPPCSSTSSLTGAGTLTCTLEDRSYYQMFLARCKCEAATISEAYN
jgi:hypothetical protein